MKKPFVISTSSLSGSSKTAVTNALKAQLVNAAVISFDDYGDLFISTVTSTNGRQIRATMNGIPSRLLPMLKDY